MLVYQKYRHIHIYSTVSNRIQFICFIPKMKV